jgi:hypothetical protein
VDAFVIINNTNTSLAEYFSEAGVDTDHKVRFINPVDPLCFEQSLNVAIKHSYFTLGNHDYMLWSHNDIIAKPNAIATLLHEYTSIREKKWGILYGDYDHLCLFNPNFFVKENIWGDPALFPNYFGDNHRYRLMDLRGYERINAKNMEGLVTHLGSQTIIRNPYFKKINDLTFSSWGQIYVNIWGGYPPNETNNDPTCGGLYPIKE